MSTDAIVLLKADHKEIRKLFREFERPARTPQAARARSSTRSSSC